MLCFTGEASASGIMVKEHLSERSVTRYNLEVALQFTQMWGPRFCQRIKTTLLDPKPYSKFMCVWGLKEREGQQVWRWPADI